MKPRRTMAGTLASTLLPLTLLLTGCGGATSIADPPSSPPTSPASPPPQRETPQHFIRRWAAEDTRMQNTGDTRAFRAMSAACQGCDAVATHVNEIYTAGGYLRTPGWTVLRVIQMQRTPRGGTWDIIVNSAPTTYVTHSGAPANHYSGGRERFELQLRSKGGTWAVTRFVQIAT